MNHGNRRPPHPHPIPDQLQEVQERARKPLDQRLVRTNVHVSEVGGGAAGVSGLTSPAPHWAGPAEPGCLAGPHCL